MDFTNLLKMVHVLGSTVFLGNIIITFFWKIMANRSGNIEILAFSQKQVALADAIFTTTAATAVSLSGYALAKLMHINVVTNMWMLLAQVFFFSSAALWALILVPIQAKQLLLLKRLGDTENVPEQYWSLSRKWNVIWITATVLPIISLILMVLKPGQ